MNKEFSEKLSRSTCKTCKFFDRTATESNEGLCRESSPQVSIVMLPHQESVLEKARLLPQAVANFPQVGDDCWCGKYTAKWGQLTN